MAIAHYLAGEYITTVDTGLNDGGSVALTGAGPGKAQQLYGVLIKALGTITVVDVTVTNAAANAIYARFGGTQALQNGGVFQFSAPVCGLVNNNMLITCTLTGATAGSVAISATYKLANS